jgi:hypothetical protein
LNNALKGARLLAHPCELSTLLNVHHMGMPGSCLAQEFQVC